MKKIKDLWKTRWKTFTARDWLLGVLLILFSLVALKPGPTNNIQSLTVLPPLD